MITTNKISLNTIIAKVYRDFGLKEEEDYYNFYEWGAEALEQIGAFNQLDTKYCPIDINFYKGELPRGLVAINQVSYNRTPLLPSTSTKGPLLFREHDRHDDKGLSVNIEKVENVVFDGPVYTESFHKNYTLSNGYIKVGFETGILELSYQSIPLDCDGIPLCPDDVSYREAVYRYIVYKYLYPRWVTGQVPNAVYQDAEQKWQWYCGQAGAKAMMPDLGTLENIKRNYIRLKPEIYHFDNFFENLNK